MQEMLAEFLLSIAPSKSVSEKPLIEVIGVFSSWETFAKSLFSFVLTFSAQ